MGARWVRGEESEGGEGKEGVLSSLMSCLSDGVIRRLSLGIMRAGGQRGHDRTASCSKMGSYLGSNAHVIP